MKRHLHWILAAGGFGLGIIDTAALGMLGIDVALRGSASAGAAVVGGWFGASFALLGFLLGRLWQARDREREAAETIGAQADALEVSRRAAFQNEKLASIGRLAAGIAHEVRNPLGVIRSSAALVREDFAPGQDQHRALGFICDETDRLDGLIRSLLAFARPVDLERRDVALAPLFARAIELATPQLEAAGVAVFSEGEIGSLAVDPDLLSQVVLDLVTNAAEADSTGRIVIRSAGSSDRIAVEVADDGPGIPAEHGERVFEPFFTTKARGTGLGLAMASRIVEAHGGALRIVRGRGAGPDGRGACFRMELPRAEAA